jgi:CRP/FNR family cyclic AMP-dependent transcriptional regulator
MNPAELFRQDSDPLALDAGQALFKAGDAASEMYVLLEGQAEIRVGDTVLEIARPGALLGEMAMIEHAPRAATVLAGAPCKFARISHHRFTFLIQQNPFFAIHVMKVLVDRLRAMNQRLVTAD